MQVKNVCNILLKNTLDYAVASLIFMLCGYAFMFSTGNGFIGWSGIFLNGAENPFPVAFFAFLLFQTAFCGVAATIFSGWVAERRRPCGAFPVHGLNGIWGTLSNGLFATETGLFYTGSWSQLGVQALGACGGLRQISRASGIKKVNLSPLTTIRSLFFAFLFGLLSGACAG